MIYADEEIEITLPWRVICAAACQALIGGISFEEFVRQAIAAGIKKESP